MTTIVYETHSITTDNEAGIATGWLPGELSDRGWELAAELRVRRRDDGITAVFTPDLRRAVQTAEIAFTDSEIPIFQDERLRECDHGTWNGMPVGKLAAERAKHIETPWPGGQSYRQVVEHTRDFLRHRSGDQGRILVIAHSANRWALQHLLDGVPLEVLVDAPFDWQPGWTFELPEGWGRQPAPRNDVELRERVHVLAAGIVAGTAYSYWASWEIFGLGMDLHTQLSTGLNLVWGALTDWVERRPKERAEAESRMQEAAAEWLAVEHDPAAEQRYFDRWVHGILGYDRDPRGSH